MADLTGGRLTLSFDIRHPVTLDIAPILERLNAALSEMGFTMAPTVSQPGLHLPCDHPLVAALSRVYARATGRRPNPSPSARHFARTLPCAVAFGPVFPGRAKPPTWPTNTRRQHLMAAARVYALAWRSWGICSLPIRTFVMSNCVELCLFM
jgi:acetylornithine deacetylase/succinyl-diaminopimelate desuccinylase-like protein